MWAADPTAFTSFLSVMDSGQQDFLKRLARSGFETESSQGVEIPAGSGRGGFFEIVPLLKSSAEVYLQGVLGQGRQVCGSTGVGTPGRSPMLLCHEMPKMQ